MKKVREVALDCILAVHKNGAYSNLLLNNEINKSNLNGKDIALLTELVYGTIQNETLLNYYLDPFFKNPKKVEPWVRYLLQLSFYQMILLEKIPDRAVIFEAVEIAKKRGHKGISSMVNGVLRSLQRNGHRSTEEIKDEAMRISVETSHPLWLVKEWITQYGVETTRRICEINLTPPVATARVNVMKTSVAEMMDVLREKGFDVEEGDLSQDAIKLLKGNIAKTSEYEQGYVSIQDESSMLVARALGVKEGQSVLDTCAAPGGKTSHIAELLHNTGKVMSFDLHKHKAKLIRQQVERLGLTNVEVGTCDARKITTAVGEQKFDRILIDAPCSGLGVIRRKPDIKWSKTKEDVLKLVEIQKEILNEVSSCLKDNGILVYSTCTIEKDENEEVINHFLQTHPNFELDMTLSERMPNVLVDSGAVKNGQIQVLPSMFGTDGFYIACLRKKVK
ncbi:MAG: 16S rRNA (cytosine(967)-C(5))-methyltransferase RsmB [Bacillaceae bacterium]